MHKGYAHNNNVGKKVQRIFYNSSLAYSESEYPFQNVQKTEDLKSLRVNLAHYKQKLQNQFQKCRDYIKEVSPPKTNSSGVLKEVILENLGKKSKNSLLKHMHKMGLNIKEASGNNETIIVVDLSPISTNKKALEKFMSYLEKVKDKDYSFPQRRTEKGISRVELSDEKKLTQERGSQKESNSKKYVPQVNLNSGQNNPSAVPKVNNRTTIKKNERVYFCEQPHYYNCGQSSCLYETSNEDKTSKSHKYVINKAKGNVPETSYITNCFTKDIQKRKSEDSMKKTTDKNTNDLLADISNLSKKRNIRLSTNSVIQNLFLTTLPSKVHSHNNVKLELQPKELRSKSPINKIINFFKLIFFAKKKRKKVVVPITQVYSVFSNETKKVPSDKSISFKPDVTLLDDGKSRKPETNENEEKVEVEEDPSRSISGIKSVLNEKPAEIWGRKIFVESKKEIGIVAKQRLERATDRSATTFLRDRLNEIKKESELESILNQQTEIKGMIENIQNTLLKSEQPPRSEESSQSCPHATCNCHNEDYQYESCKYSTSEPWSKKATMPSNDTSCCSRSHYDSMTNLPSNTCWCPDICGKFKNIYKCLCTNTNLDTHVKCELQDQRREIIRLNKLLHLHLLESQHN